MDVANQYSQEQLCQEGAAKIDCCLTVCMAVWRWSSVGTLLIMSWSFRFLGWLTRCCSLPLSSQGFFSKDVRNLPPAIVPKDKELLDSLGVSWHDEVSDDEWKHVGFGTEVRLLFKREIIHNSRNKKGVGARFALTTFMAILVGNIFFGVGGASSFTDPSVRELVNIPFIGHLVF